VLPVSQPQSAPMEEAVPVLANTAIRPQTVAALPVAHAAAPRVAKASPMQPKPSAPASFASSFAPGENVLPHPPYPQEAQDLGETGTVVMTVTFNISGDVIQATVAQSSGVRLLDTMTRSFILSHWHSASLAGQTVSQPVRYMGE
jgi:TonB family protein